MTDRSAAIDDFLQSTGWGDGHRRLLAGDASFRRYERVEKPDGRTAVLMDAPPPQEDIRPFIGVGRYLSRLGLSAPAILAPDVARGFMLLEDLGDDSFSAVAAADPAKAAAALRGGGRCPGRTARGPGAGHHKFSSTAPGTRSGPYDARAFGFGPSLVLDWHVKALRLPLEPEAVQAFSAIWGDLWRRLPRERAVIMLRDYHADNLLWLPGRTGAARVGLLDFQDATMGPAAYDLVSLIEDARRDVDPAFGQELKARYAAGAARIDPGFDAAAFEASYAIMGGAAEQPDRRGLRPLVEAGTARSAISNSCPGSGAIWSVTCGIPCWPISRPGTTIICRARICAPASGSWPHEHDRDRHGAGRRQGHAHAPADRPAAETPGRGPRAEACSTGCSTAWPRAASGARWSMSITSPIRSKPGSTAAGPRGWGRRPKSRTSGDALLETGGGVARALPLLGPAPFFICNADTFWLQGVESPIAAMRAAFDPARMDGLLLLASTATAVGLEGAGDFLMDEDGPADPPPGTGRGALRLCRLRHHAAGGLHRPAGRGLLPEPAMEPGDCRRAPVRPPAGRPVHPCRHDPRHRRGGGRPCRRAMSA